MDKRRRPWVLAVVLTVLLALFPTVGLAAGESGHDHGAASPSSDTRVPLRVLLGDRLVTEVSAHKGQETLMVPLRHVAEALGAIVHWEGATETIYITQSGIGQPAGHPGATMDATLRVNGLPIQIPLYIVNGRSQVPLEFFAAWGSGLVRQETVGAALIRPEQPAAGQSPSLKERAYAVMGSGDSVTVFDTARDRVLDVISADQLPAAANSHGIAVTPDGAKLFVASMQSPRISAYDVAGQRLREVDLGFTAHHLYAGPAGRYVYATELGGTRLAVIDAVGDRVLTTLESGKGVYMPLASADGRFVYVTNMGANSVAVVRTGDWQVTTSVPVGKGPSHLALDPVSGRLLVTNTGSNDVSVIDLAAGRVVATVPVGKAPHGISVSAGKAFVANAESSDVTMIRVETAQVVQKIPVGEKPGHVHTTRTGQVYVQVEKENQLKVLDPKSGAIAGSLDLISDGHQIAVPSGR